MLNTMKRYTQFALILTLLVLCQLNLFAAQGEEEKSSGAKPCLNLNKAVKRLMSYSDFNENEQIQGSVVVKYNIDQNNIVNINEMQSNDDRLKDYVYSKLNGKQVCDNNTDNKDQLIKINFTIK